MSEFLTHFLGLPKLHVDGGRDLQILYGVRFLLSLTENFSLFFLPIFLFQLGESGKIVLLSELSPLKNGLLLIAIHFVLLRITILFVLPLVLKVLSTKGHAMTFLLAHVGHALVFSLLWFVALQPWLVFLVGPASGLVIAAFWPTYHDSMSRHMLRSHLGEDLGLMQFLIQLAQMAAPAIGGVIIVTLGYQVLFLISLLLVVSSALLCLFLNQAQVGSKIIFGEVMKLLKHWSFRRQCVSFVGRYCNDAVLSLWPVYVFLLLQGVDKVGFLYSLSFFIAMLMSMMIGFYIDHQRSHKGFFASGGVLSFLWVIRSLVVSVWSIAIVDALDRLVGNFHWLFYETLIYKVGKGKDSLTYFVAREIVISLTGLCFWLAAIGLFIVIEKSWTVLFLVAALGVLLSLSMSDRWRYDQT